MTSETAGTEWVVDAIGCSPERLCDETLLRLICRQIVDELRLTVLGQPQWHRFPPQNGVTGLTMLSESHLACHTYPELGLATFNLYCCRDRAAWPWEARLRELLEAQQVTVRRVVRGVGMRGPVPGGAPVTTFVAACPSCGAPIRFEIGSAIVVVCQNCQSAVARTDRALEDLGKVAAVVETDSPLKVGLKGSHRGKPFEIMGRIQYRHESGALWNEWYASFPEDRWGWLAEAQGKFYLTFEGKLSKDAALPAQSQLIVGQQFTVPSIAKFTVAEIGRAAAEGAEGEIPFRFTPGEAHDYADLAAGGGKFATFDYGSTPPSVFVGREVTLNDLDLESAPMAERDDVRIGGVTLNCPNGSGSLELRAPDETLRVTCPYCTSLLDVTQGKLQYLTTLGGGAKPLIPIGTKGTLEGVSYMVIGFVHRQVTIDDIAYFWQEYLLYCPGKPFRWLVHSDNHWSFVRGISPGEVDALGARRAKYEGKTFKLFQMAPTYVVYVLGEFYWRVAVGEETLAADFVHPPQMLSMEKSGSDERGEINWSMGTYVEKEVVAAAFGVKKMPRPMGVAPNQPFKHNGVLLAWPLLCAVALVTGIMLLSGAKSRTIVDKTYTVAPAESLEKPTIIFDDKPLELQSRQNICVTLRSSLSNSSMFVGGDLFSESSGLTQSFSANLEDYHGVEDGEAWSEGSKQATIYLSALPKGEYTLRLEVYRDNFRAPGSVSVKIEQDHRRVLYLFLLLFALSVVPALVLFWRWRFEKTRWENSQYGG